LISLDAGRRGSVRIERWQVVLGVLGFVGVAAVVGGLTASVNLFHYSALKKHGASSPGVVTETRCSHHNTVLYEFQVQGRTFQGSTSAGWLAPNCSVIHAGDRLQVTFLPADPSVNGGGDFPSAYRNEVVSVLLAALGVPSLLTAVVVFRAFRRRSAAGV
jgi:hypothetical protein